MIKTILVHVDQSIHAPARMRCAAALAHAHGAHLLGAAMLGVSRSMLPHGDDRRQAILEAREVQPLADDARQALARFGEVADEAGVRHRARIVCDRADDGLARLARFADLVVLSQDDPLESTPDMAVHLPEYVILHAARPVLVVPRAGDAPWRRPKALVAWDGSREASLAMHAALPLLRQAPVVTVVSLAGAGAGEEAFRIQQQDLLHYLGLHHVAPRLLVRAPRRDSGRDLLDLAAELDCGLLVMGCFGHGRLRELCLGGASRTALADAPVALLMAH